MLDLETRDAFNIVNDPNIKEEKDIRMAMALIKNLYKEGKIDGEIYDKAMLNAKIMIAQSGKKCYTENEDRIINNERRHRR
ncbi:MAG: hypothetical protein K6B68_13725 [Eubacterium sp.]|nr:hypothetical protein [Eubacterium sp.]